MSRKPKTAPKPNERHVDECNRPPTVQLGHFGPFGAATKLAPIYFARPISVPPFQAPLFLGPQSAADNSIWPSKRPSRPPVWPPGAQVACLQLSSPARFVIEFPPAQRQPRAKNKDPSLCLGQLCAGPCGLSGVGLAAEWHKWRQLPFMPFIRRPFPIYIGPCGYRKAPSCTRAPFHFHFHFPSRVPVCLAVCVCMRRPSPSGQQIVTHTHTRRWGAAQDAPSEVPLLCAHCTL